MQNGRSRGRLRVWDPAGGQVVRDAAAEEGVHRLQYTPDGKHLAVVHSDMVVRFWDPRTGRQDLPSLTSSDPGPYAALSPDGKLLAVARQVPAISLTVKDLTTGDTSECRPPAPDKLSFVTGLAFSPDGKYLAAIQGLSIRVWETGSGRPVAVCRGHTKPSTFLAFSPDGSRLASAGLDGTTRIWDVGTGEEKHTVIGPIASVVGTDRTLAFSPDGKRLVSAEPNFTVIGWDLVIGQAVLTLKVPAEPLAVTFSPDGRRLAAGTRNGDVLILSAPPAAE